jgi:predicted hydrocarbon binding protein
MTLNHKSLYCSSQMEWIILQGMEEIMGEGGMRSILHKASLSDRMTVQAPQDNQFSIPFADISRLQQTLEQMYGPLGGRGVAQRSGRASFHYGLRLFGDKAGFNSLDFRLLPAKLKLRRGADSLAELLGQISDQYIRMEEDEKSIYWIAERCPLCWGRHADKPVCHLQVGFLQEFLYWASGGKYFNVVETECAAVGAPACVFRIDQQALD